MKKKYYIIIGIIIILFIGLFLYFSSIRLKGKKIVRLSYDEVYKESGYSSILKVKVKNNIKNKIGVYKITYNNLIFKKIRKVIVEDKVKPTITLNEQSNYVLLLNEEFNEPGYIAFDEYDGDITKNVKIINAVDNKKIGSYKITYVVKDSSKNEVKVERIINVVNTLYKNEYENLDNKLQGWYTSNKQNNTRPRDSENLEFRKNNVYFLGDDKKTIYLTFDEGGSITYVPQIVEILNKHKVKATFFFCKNYISNNPDLMKKILNDGHSIGNHTVSHLSMPSLAVKENFDSYYSELKQTELAFFQATGKSMEKLFRYPMGEYSNRTIAIMKQMGYRSIFWSAAYKDWDSNYNKEYSLNNMKNQLHNGAVYLIHPKCKGNYEALDDFLTYLEDNRYKVDLVKNI